MRIRHVLWTLALALLCEGCLDTPSGIGPEEDASAPPDLPLDAGPAGRDLFFTADPGGAPCSTDPECAERVGPLGPCRRAVCDPDLLRCVVVNRPPGTTCDDGDPCTKEDGCFEGACRGAPVEPCQCQNDDDCLPMDDGNLCNGTLRCEDATCVEAPEGVVECPEPGDPCLVSRCAPATGLCSPAPAADGSPCGLGDPCTAPGACAQGNCVGAGPVSCDDKNPCTEDACLGGGCVYAPLEGAPCDDGDPCRIDDVCAAGACTPGTQAAVCDDGNPCTVDACVPFSGCIHDPWIGACDDGDPCTLGDTCAEGACVAGLARSCDDGNPCTIDACNPVQGCTHLPGAAVPCDDKNPCTPVSACVEGICASGPNMCACTEDGDCPQIAAEPLCDTPLICVGGHCLLAPFGPKCGPTLDPCTASVCDPATGGCVQKAAPEGAICDDGDPCTYADVCVQGSCHGTPMLCDDGNPCTDAGCAPELGCVFTAKDGGTCDDGDPCTGGDTCKGGVCFGEAMLCGACQSAADCQAALPPNPCTNGYVCIEGGCEAGPPVVCDDGLDTLCLRAACDPVSGGCVMVPEANGSPCEDFDPCTTDDTCSGGVCLGTPRICDDGDPCTDDDCDGVTGACVGFPNDAPCDDGNPCTQADTCDGGTCVGGDNTCKETCDNGVDDDKDAFVDCVDADCDEHDSCPNNCQVATTLVCGASLSASLSSDNATDRISAASCAAGSNLSGPELTFDVTTPDCLAALKVVVRATGIWTGGGESGPSLSIMLLPGDPIGCRAEQCVKQASGPADGDPIQILLPSAAATSWSVVVDGIDGAIGAFSVTTSCSCVTP